MDYRNWIRQNRTNPRELIGRSPVSRHPYGFIIFSPDWRLEGYEVRLHVWLKDALPRQVPDWPAHAHDADMTSLVLRGRLKNITWRTPRLGYGQPLFSVQRQQDKSFLHKTSVPIELGEAREETVGQWAHYSVPTGVFHDTRNAFNGASASACFFNRPAFGHALVVGEDGGPSERVEFDRSFTDQTLIQEAAEVAIDALEMA